MPLQSSENTIVLRLHLVRHAETTANLQHHVIGQSDSPLTDHGIMQALSLGAFYQSQWFSSATARPNYFWRVYSSDLQRTKHTTQLLLSRADKILGTEVLSISDSDSCVTAYDPHDTIGVNFGVQYDSRLREIARGLNQGLPKHYTSEEALEIYKSGNHPLYSCHSTGASLPMSESNDDVWVRFYASWLTEVVHHISLLNHNGSIGKDQVKYPLDRVNVLVVTHGALLRVFLQRLIGQERLRNHCDACYKTVDGAHGHELRLDVPNTSVTILDIHINASSFEVVLTEIVQLTSTEHFGFLAKNRQFHNT